MDRSVESTMETLLNDLDSIIYDCCMLQFSVRLLHYNMFRCSTADNTLGIQRGTEMFPFVTFLQNRCQATFVVFEKKINGHVTRLPQSNVLCAATKKHGHYYYYCCCHYFTIITVVQ